MKKEIKTKPVKKTERELPMARINTRIRQDQHKYIKGIAKKSNSTEGEIFRAIIDSFIEFNTK